MTNHQDTSTEREQLEILARAYGVEPIGHHPAGGAQYNDADGQCWVFDPANRDGEAFRLMAKTGIVFSPYFANVLRIELHSCAKGEESKAYRRAIVRAVLREEELRSGKS